MWRWNLSTVVMLLAATTCAAQSVNIDYGDSAGTPAPTYAAAGLPGVWNNLTAGAGTPEALVNVTGMPTTATVTRNFGFIFGFQSPPTTGDDESLMDDGAGGMGDIVMTMDFQGLRNGEYQLIVYGWSPFSAKDSTLVFVDHNVNDGEVLGGPWPGGMQEGITHAVFPVVAVTDTTLNIEAVGGVWGDSGFINGLQLRRLTAADLTNDGVVNMDDLLTVVNNWGNPCPPLCELSCVGDVNFNCQVDIDDLLAVINDWG